mgnify:FL=1
MPVWPADLSAPIFKSILITGIKSTLRGDMDSGPAKQRPPFTKAPRMVSLSYLLFLAYRHRTNFYGLVILQGLQDQAVHFCEHRHPSVFALS